MAGAIKTWFAGLRKEIHERLTTGSTLRYSSPYALAEAQARAKAAEHRLREALNVLPEGIVFLDAEGRYVLWNDSYADMYARSADLFREGVKLADTLRIGVERGDYPQAVGREEEWLAERMALLNNPGVRHEQRLANGRWIMIEERRTQDGGIIGLRVDITEMKAQSVALETALETAQAASRSKDEFLANMSHELRTPLNGVIGIAEILARTPLEPKQRELLATLKTSATDLETLVRDLLDFTRLEAGKLEIREQSFDLHALAAEACALFRAPAAKKGVDLRLVISPDAPAQVVADPARLKQILVNLLSNAVKFTHQGRIELSLGPDSISGCMIQVRDTGIGFDAAQTERLFDRFEQADGSSTRQFGGIGLGLSICRQLATLMGGAITADGQVGVGAVFTVFLPLTSQFPATLPQAPQPALEAERPLRVLACDDNPTNRKVVELMLSQVGAEVMSCENGLEALNAFRREAFDLILMDLQMPVMDGLTATREIRADELMSARSKTPLVVISANASPEDRAATAAAGADAHVGKPIRADELIAAMAYVLDGAVENGDVKAA